MFTEKLSGRKSFTATIIGITIGNMLGVAYDEYVEDPNEPTSHQMDLIEERCVERIAEKWDMFEKMAIGDSVKFEEITCPDGIKLSGEFIIE